MGLYLEGITTSKEPNDRFLGSLNHIQQQSFKKITCTIIVWFSYVIVNSSVNFFSIDSWFLLLKLEVATVVAEGGGVTWVVGEVGFVWFLVVVVSIEIAKLTN